MAQVKILRDPHTLTDSAVALFISQAKHSIEQRGKFSVALSGGSTPKPIYQVLGELQTQPLISWNKIHLFWGDERHVPPGHTDSNYRMVNDELLEKIEIPAENVHRVPAEMEVRIAAFNYEEELQRFFEGDWPRFDLVLLGMGNDGHTASLFPNSAGLNEEDRWFIANYAPVRKTWRLTLTKNAINHARQIVVLVRGTKKAEMLRDVLTGPKIPFEKPIQLIEPINGKMTWLVDRASAKHLSPDDHSFISEN